MRTNTEPDSFAIFPFLKTSGRIQIGRFTFRSSDDRVDLTLQQAMHLDQISRMLFWRDDLRIELTTVAVVPFLDFDNRQSSELLTELAVVREVVAYLYAGPHPTIGGPFLSSENASMAVFSPGMVSVFLVRPDYNVRLESSAPPLEPDDTHEVAGYAGLYNFRHGFWVTTGSRLHGPLPHMTLNIAQDLANDFSRDRVDPTSGLLLDSFGQYALPTTDRVLAALRWFNAATSKGNDEAAAIIDLAIAFETLLALPADQKTDRVVDAISLLLGRIPRLNEWASQFYRARSSVVHEGRAQQVRFVANAKNAKTHLYQPLISYGFMVFRLCVGAVLAGARLARDAGLEEKLVTNQERFEQLCKLLDDSAIDEKERLRLAQPIISTIAHYKFVWESGLDFGTMLGALRRVARLASDLDSVPEALQDALATFAATPQTTDHYEALDALRQLDDTVRTGGGIGERKDPWRTAVELTEVVWHYTFMYFFQLRRQRRPQ